MVSLGVNGYDGKVKDLMGEVGGLMGSVGAFRSLMSFGGI
jgi:hypothetical protein